MPAISISLSDENYDKIKNLPNRSDLMNLLLFEHFNKLKKTRQTIEDIEQQKREIEAKEREIYDDMEGVKIMDLEKENKKLKQIKAIQQTAEESFSFPLSEEEVIECLLNPNLKNVPDYIDYIKEKYSR